MSVCVCVYECVCACACMRMCTRACAWVQSWHTYVLKVAVTWSAVLLCWSPLVCCFDYSVQTAFTIHLYTALALFF